MTTTKPKTKLVEIELAALTRVCWAATVEVPEDFTDEELSLVVDAMYTEIDGGEYHDDIEFWDKGECYHSGCEPQGEAQFSFDEDMNLTRITAMPGGHCPAEGCPGVIEPPGSCSHCGRDYIDKQQTD
jgi:hypothetical protein